MSNDLPGNAYFRAAIQAMEAADEFDHPPAEWSALVATQVASVMATLALAYEQRTANLIAKLELSVSVLAAAGVRIESTDDGFNAIDDELLDRLGLNGDK